MVVIIKTYSVSMNHKTYLTISNSFISSVIALLLSFAIFLLYEPNISQAIVSTFRVTQSVTAEISFVVTPSNVAMSPAIAGITGGNSAGTTSVRVRTNNDIGYNMTIAFSSSTAMRQTSQGNLGSISNYNPTTINVPDLTFANEVFSQFGYTIIASTSADLNTSFRDSGAACNTGSNNTVNTCWLNPSTTAKTIISTSLPTSSSGSTSTVAFRINIPPNAVPLVPEGGYTATATLTAVIN